MVPHDQHMSAGMPGGTSGGTASSSGVATALGPTHGPGGAPGPASVANWNISYTTRPARVVLARDIAHVQEVVRDSLAYPSPVTVVGSMHSVNECIVNDGGTLLCTAGMDNILGMVGSGEQRLVKVQAGCKLAKLHKWLAAQGSEISFSPEIGDATVGSLVTTTSKDSSLGGLGYLSSLVYDVTYVDDNGDVVTLCSGRDGEALSRFISSNGLLGIVVEATLEARPLAPVRTVLHFLLVNKKLPGRLLRLKGKADNLFAIISTDGFVYVEQRFKSGFKRPIPGWGWVTWIIARIKNGAFRKGNVNMALGGFVLINPLLRFFPALHYRHELVNSYPKVSAKEPRLDFTFYEFPLEKFVAVVNGMLEQVEAFRKDTGFKPTGLAMYFVTRPGTKPAGSFSGPPGTSFMMDPFHSDPCDARWLALLAKLNEWALAQGARLSPTQTKVCGPAHCQLPGSYAKSRFTSPYYQQFIV